MTPRTTLRIALLSYRGKPFCGGQGVYVRNLSRELAALGHSVEVISGPPYPVLDNGVRLTRLPSLDLFAEPNPFRTPALRELRALPDWLEFAAMRRGGFGEPLAFSLRALWHLARRRHEFDVVHDNQCLGYGLLGVRALGLPVIATVHHPIAIDAELSREAGGDQRWYRFVRMQHQVARRLPAVLTVSGAARDQITTRMDVPPERIGVTPLAADRATFRPRPDVDRVPGRIVAIASADEPLKGLDHLLRAMPMLRERGARLVVVGRLKEDGPTAKLVADLGLESTVDFVHGLTGDELAGLFASAEVACVPSVFEGFSLPAVEAMTCGTPLVATTAGALPEVVGDAALLVPPANPAVLAGALTTVLRDSATRARLAAASLARAESFSWRATAEKTVTRYRTLLDASAVPAEVA
ncbi:glycosyltransferase involved in cell wall biosynthesis [Herbihabitans rhizosphaerae]|uniref:Glycosyltransferase involved in cell wall biosynthesis n=1 Tax=Herbihabitans rhizosphaerae TaxID=1872711 RepID=A0A4Q7L572_9PSEU|nr:glycosyltransferase family 4 protein [Herbihabitans rhizosphaerae]RZS43392.1 glycosyltransferase involved in cell wall biosynthesis [Herbihabitans rhizosphaerae]